jgi:CBS domain-containing protein
MKVQDVMTSNVKTCHPETDLAAVVVMMWDGDYDLMPVVNGAGTLVGIITDRDILIATATKGRLASSIPVSEVMTGRVYTCASHEEGNPAGQT